MTINIAQLKFIKDLYASHKCHYENETFKFDVIFSDELLSSLDMHEIEFTVRVTNKNVRRPLYQNYKDKQVSILIEKDFLGCERNIHETWNSFLDYKANLLTCPQFFWIISDNFYFNQKSESSHNSKIFNNYLEVCSLINLLVDTSDYQDKPSGDIVESVIFLHKSKLEVPTWYKYEDLANSLDGISVVMSMFNDNLHRDHKISILKEVLCSILSNVAKAKRLKYLFEHFGEFSTRLTDNYQLFVSEFSFDSVRVEYEEKKRDYITKLNDVLSSVQAKMLGIPVSLGFLSLKFESSNMEHVISDHVALSAGVVIYCIMMFLLIRNQLHTLQAVKDEYSSLMDRLKYKHAEQHNTIKTIRDNLDKRYLFQWRTLQFFNFLTFLLLASLFYFL